MKKIMLFLFIGTIFLSLQYSQKVKSKSFLWEIKVPGGSSSYLLGSIHVMKPGHYLLKPHIEEAFRKCDQLAVELIDGQFTPNKSLNTPYWKKSNTSYRDARKRAYKQQKLSDYKNRAKTLQSQRSNASTTKSRESYKSKKRREYQQKQKIMASRTKQGLYGTGGNFKEKVKAGSSVADRVSMSYKLKMKMGQFGISYDIINKYPPWTIRNIISAAILQKHGYYYKYGIDLHFLNKAYWANKQVLSLENRAVRNRIYRGISRKENEEYLLFTIDRLESMETTFLKTVDAWLVGDTNLMHQTMMDADGTTPPAIVTKINKRMLEDRNRVMTKTILRELKAGRTIFAIAGAAHMVGPNSIVQLLKDNGYQLIQH